MDDVLDGTWSVKVNGLTRGHAGLQTIPQNVKFEAGARIQGELRLPVRFR